MFRAVNELLKRLHIWVGLFNFTIILVFAAAGLHVSLQPAPAERIKPTPIVRELAYDPAKDMTDREVADDVHAKLAIPLSAPIPGWALGRNAENVLVLDFYTQNGIYKATVMEEEKKVRVEYLRNSVGEFFDIMHGTTLYHSSPDLRLRLWAIYVDLSIFSLLFMTLTGLWLWWTSRPRLWWARASLLTGSLLFGALWVVTR